MNNDSIILNILNLFKIVGVFVKSHIELVSNHAVHSLVDALEKRISDTLLDTELEVGIVEELNRELLIILTFKQILDESDKKFISLGILNKTSDIIGRLTNNINGFVANRTENYIENNKPIIEELLEAIPKISMFNTRGELNVANNIIKEYSDKLDYIVGLLQSKTKSVISENNVLVEKIKQQNEEIENLKVTVEQLDDVNKNNINNNLNDLRENSHKLLDEFRQNNNNTLSDYEKSLKTTLNDDDEKYKAQRDNFNILYTGIKDEKDELIASISEELDGYVETVKNIVGQVNTTMFSYKYKQVADDAKNRSLGWNVAVAISMIVAIALAYYTLDSISSLNGYDNYWFAVISRSIIVLLAVSFAAYSAKQADYQNRVERYARKVEMELVAFDTFVSDLKEEKRVALKESIAQRIFINREDIIEENTKVDSGLGVEKMVSEIVGKVTEQIPKINIPK